MSYAMHRLLRGVSFEDAVSRARLALQNQGFGIPVEMDTQTLFKAKLSRESERRVILGACLAPVAFEVLRQEPDLAVLLPCNVVVREVEGGCDIVAVSPKALFALADNTDPSHAEVIEDKLKAALASLS
jgi:uncharacterized protein (DUF302 family)